MLLRNYTNYVIIRNILSKRFWLIHICFFFSKWHKNIFCFQSFHSLLQIRADAHVHATIINAHDIICLIFTHFSVESQGYIWIYRMELFIPLSILCIPRAFKSVMKPGISFTNSVVYTIYRRNVWKVFFERAECIGAFMSPEMENKPLFVELHEKEVTKMFYGCLRWLWSASMGPWRRTGITHDGRDIVKRIRYS